MSRKNILWVSHMVPYPPKGGLLQRSFNLIKEVSKHHDVTLLAFNQRALLKSDEEIAEAKTQLSKYCNVDTIIDIESDSSKLKKIALLGKSLLPQNTYTVSWLSSATFGKRLIELLGNNDFDLIHYDTISLAQYLPGDVSQKVCLNHHNIESLMMIRRAENETNYLKKLYFYMEGKKLKRYERDVCKKFDLNITCSPLDTDVLRKEYRLTSTITIPNGADLTYFSPSISRTEQKNSLVFAGGLSWYPNIDAVSYFLKGAWPKLKESIPGITFTIVGRNPPDWLLDFAHNDPAIEVTGFVEDVRPYLDRASVYLCPIRDGGGTKLKVLDALAMKKILISDPIACEGINVIDGESVIFARSTEEYIEKITMVLTQPEKYSSIAERGYELMRAEYDFVKIGEKLSHAYEKI